MTCPQKPPELLDRIDVYWPSCERYFRGTVVRVARPTAFAFFVHYDDNDYLRTNLNKVRWHHATAACCQGEQDVLLPHDFVAGDMQRFFRRQEEPRKPNVAEGRVVKRRREERLREHDNSEEELMNGASDVTFEASEMRSGLESSNGGTARVAEESNSITNCAQRLGMQGKDTSSETTNQRPSGAMGIGSKRRGKMDERKHWKKVMLAGYEKSCHA